LSSFSLLNVNLPFQAVKVEKKRSILDNRGFLQHETFVKDFVFLKKGRFFYFWTRKFSCFFSLHESLLKLSNAFHVPFGTLRIPPMTFLCHLSRPLCFFIVSEAGPRTSDFEVEEDRDESRSGTLKRGFVSFQSLFFGGFFFFFDSQRYLFQHRLSKGFSVAFKIPQHAHHR